MLALSDRLSVPQVFFNAKHIGGAEETIELLEKWEKGDGEGKPKKSAKERFEEEVGSQPGPDDPRLSPATDPPVEPPQPPPRDESDQILLPDGKKMSVLELTQKLKSILPMEDKKYQLKIYKKCFT